MGTRKCNAGPPHAPLRSLALLVSPSDWLWLLPIWFVFVFSFGVSIETRVFGELIPFVVCATSLILEELIVLRIAKPELHTRVETNSRITVSSAA